MKYLSILAILVAAICALNGCASTDTTTSSSRGEAVPGEAKSADESRVQPGMSSGGPNASVKW